MRRRLSQAELVERHAPHIMGWDDALIAAAMMAASTYAQQKSAAANKRKAQSQAGVGHGELGGFKDMSSAGQFMKAPSDAHATDLASALAPAGGQLLQPDGSPSALPENHPLEAPQPAAVTGADSMSGPDPSGLASSFYTLNLRPDPGMALPDKAPAAGFTGSQPLPADVVGNVDTAGLQPAPNYDMGDVTSSDPAVASSGTSLGDMMPYINAAAQVGSAIHSSYQPHPVALSTGHMGGYNPTIPDTQARLNAWLDPIRKRRQ